MRPKCPFNGCFTMTGNALLFPGQGSQYVGMAHGFLKRKESVQLFDEAEQILSLPLKKLMFEGPVDELTKTAIAQPAILLHSMLTFYAWRDESRREITCALGHSLGEYSALVCAGVISFANAIRAVHIRGKLMQEATPIGFGAMAAVMGMDAQEIVRALLPFADDKKENYASCANFNGPSQTVIAGTKIGVLQASEKLKSLGAKRIIELPVSAPFHCGLMKPVQKKMTEVLSDIPFSDAQFPIISNVSAQKETDGKKIRELLLLQIVSPVRFTDCVSYIENNHLAGDGFLEIGPKNILTSLVKKIVTLETRNIDTLDDIELFKK